MKSCKRGVQCSFYILGADKQDYEYRTSLTHIFRQIGLSLLNLNPQPSLKCFTHRKTERKNTKIRKYEKAIRRTSPTHIFHQIALSVLNLNQPLPQTFTTHHQRISNYLFFLQLCKLTGWQKIYCKQKFFSQDQKVLLAFWHKPQKLTLHWHKW